jgi:hypothetical protein
VTAAPGSGIRPTPAPVTLAHPCAVEYDHSMPPELIEAFAPHLNAWMPLVPTWCHHLLILWSDEPQGATVIENICWREYRKASIRIFPAWWSQTPTDRDRLVCHELTHFILDPLHQTIVDLKNFICEKQPELAGWISERRRDAIEQSVSDLVRAARSFGWPG